MKNHMKKFICTLASVSMFVILPASAGVIDIQEHADSGAATTSLFNQKITRSFSVVSGITAVIFNTDDMYSSLPDSFDLTPNLTPQNGANSAITRLGIQHIGHITDKFDALFLATNEFTGIAFSGAVVTGDADTGNMTYVPLLGPIPEPSISWLMVTALLALAGFSRGGIHESV